jgi:hypothetical protein
MRDGEDASVRLVVEGGPGALRELALVAESEWEPLRKLFSGEDLRTGDADFDRAVRVGGPEPPTLAVLNARTRLRIRKLVGKGSGQVVHGRVQCTVEGTLQGGEGIPAKLDELLGLARLLQVDAGQVPRLLADNACEDPDPGVRRRNLEVLARSYPERPEAKAAGHALLEDQEPSIRLLAAELCGEEGRAVLRELVADAKVDAATRAGALSQLTRRGIDHDVQDLVALAIRSREEALARAAVAAAGAHRATSLLPELLERAEGASEGLLVELVRALGNLRDPRAEPQLIALLRNEHPPVRTLACDGLAELGTVAAVEPLLELTGLLKQPAEVRTAAREAIRTIQGRLGSAEHGRLSIAEEDDRSGAVSMAVDSGAVSMPDGADPTPDPRRPVKG